MIIVMRSQIIIIKSRGSNLIGFQRQGSRMPIISLGYRSDAVVKDGLHSGENLNVRRALANRLIGFYIS